MLFPSSKTIAPLSQLIATIRRVASSSATPNAPSPLPALVSPLLMSLRDISHKYRVSIPQMIEAGGSVNPEDADLEESMIVFAWTHEKRDTERSNEAGYEEKWTKEWLSRCERREYVLFHWQSQYWRLASVFHINSRLQTSSILGRSSRFSFTS